MRSYKRPSGFGGWRWELLGEVKGYTLEIGCGQGSNFAYYPSGLTVNAFDLELGKVRTASRLRTHYPPVRMSNANAERLPFADDSFDSVVGTLVFCSIPNPARALAEIRRVLKTDGKLYLIDHVRSHKPWLGTLQDALAPTWLWATGGCNLNRDTENTVRRNGFEIEKLKIGYGGLLKLMVSKPKTNLKLEIGD